MTQQVNEHIGATHASEEALAAFALHEDDVEPSEAKHISQCIVCQREVSQLRALLAQLDERLYRFDCPPVEELSAYAEGRVADIDPAAIGMHVRECVRCADELRVVRTFLRDTDGDILPSPVIAAAAGNQITTPIAELLSGVFEAVRRVVASPASAAFARRGRGPGTGEATQTFVAEDIMLTVSHEDDDNQRGSYLVYGTVSQVGALEAPGAQRVRLLRLAEPESGGEPTLAAEAAVKPVVNEEEFEIHAVSPGRYRLEVLLPDRVIEVAALVL